MRRLQAIATVLVLGTFALACDQVPSNPEMEQAPSVATAKTTDGTPEKTTGDVYARGGAGNLNHFVFNAHMATDRKDAKGQYWFEAVDVGWSASGYVNYVESTAANEACFCGVLDEPGRASDYDGDGDAEFCVAVVDNGEPSTEEPVDLIEGAFEGLGPDRGEVAPFEGGDRCAFLRPASNEASGGNIQVHDNK